MPDAHQLPGRLRSPTAWTLQLRTGRSGHARSGRQRARSPRDPHGLRGARSLLSRVGGPGSLWELPTQGEGRGGVAGGAFRRPLSRALGPRGGVCFTQIRLSCSVQFTSVQALGRVRLSATHEPQRARPPCPSPAPGVHPNPRPLSR